MSEKSKQLNQMYQRLKLVLEILDTAKQALRKAKRQDDAESAIATINFPSKTIPTKETKIMAKRKNNKKALVPGWAIYIRTSDEDVQDPKNSRERQEYDIARSLTGASEMPIIQTYWDVESGRNPNRTQYQEMLHDAKQGLFSHIAVSNTSRFGRNAAEALRAINYFVELGVVIRFANVPSLSVDDYNARALISFLFIIDETESLRIGERTRGGLHARMRRGYFMGIAPDGYVNKQEKVTALSGINKLEVGRYIRWVEQDPEQILVWREAWRLLLLDRYTLKQICETLHAKGYTFRKGRYFLKTNAETGRIIYATGDLSRIFNNWFYAGWLVSEKVGIPPKTVVGKWEALVTTEEFERGQAILRKRGQNRVPKHYHIYLLAGILYLKTDYGDIRMTGSTPNIGRTTGGTSYYLSPLDKTHILCSKIDRQIKNIIANIGVDPDHLDDLKAIY